MTTKNATLLDRHVDEASRGDAMGAVEVSLTAAHAQLPSTAEANHGSMFERLLRDPSVDVEKLERFMAMQERVNANAARAAFNTAFAAMVGEIPVVHEGGATNNGRYARFEDIVRVVRPILQRHGFALSHTTEWPDAKTVRVIGILTHREGHERRSEFLSAADSSGNKNAIQGLGSAMSYGRRYTTLDLLNIATGDDDDGKKAGQQGKPEPKAPDGYDAWLESLQDVAAGGNWADYGKFWNESEKAYRTHLTRTAPELANKLQLKAKGATK